MENENMQETSTDVLETEEVQQTDVSVDANSAVSDGNISETSNVEDVTLVDPEETTTETKTEETPVEESGTTYTQEEMEQIVATVLASQNEVTTASEEITEVRTIFNTPLEEYEIGEGLLLLILLVLLAGFINSIFKGSHFMSKLR